jgi:hypothetical protein
MLLTIPYQFQTQVGPLPLSELDADFAAVAAAVNAGPTQAMIGGNFYPVTAAETAAAVIPVNFIYPPGVVDRYGTNTTPGTTNMLTAIRAALAAAAAGEANSPGFAVTFLAGVYGFSADLTIPMGDPYLLGGGTYAVTIQGQGREQTVLKAIAGGAFTHGLYFNGGSAYENMGTLKNLQIDGNGLLSDAISVSFGQMGIVENVSVRNCTGRGLYINNCLMTRLSNIFVTTCGSASVAQVEIDGTLAGTTGGTTTILISQMWVQSGNASCVAGINIDRANNVTVLNGAFESSGIGVQISSKATTVGCNAIIFDTVDIEAVTTAYVTAGVGLSGSHYVTAMEFRNCAGEAPSGTPAQALFLQQCNGARFVNNNWLLGAGMTEIYNLFGTSNINTVIEPHPAMNNAASAVPYVIVNGAQVRSAGPLVRWDQVTSVGAPLSGSKTVTGTTWSVWVDGATVNQGGWYNVLIAGNSGASAINALPGDAGMRISIVGDGFSTIPNGVGAGQFDTVAGANLLLLANHLYEFRMDTRGCWRQLGTA